MMAASKPTSYLSERLHCLSDLTRIWDLIRRSWAVSLSTMKLSPHCLTAGYAILSGLRSLTDFGTPVGALDRSVLYTRWKYCPTLPLKAFRREPAITQFDKSFAPILSSF